MREILFHLQEHSGGLLSASADRPPLTIEAATLEELHHEAREALIAHFGPSHVAYRVRIRRSTPRLHPLHRHSGSCLARPA
jgi:hypothetical protein